MVPLEPMELQAQRVRPECRAIKDNKVLKEPREPQV